MSRYKTKIWPEIFSSVLPHVLKRSSAKQKSCCKAQLYTSHENLQICLLKFVTLNTLYWISLCNCYMYNCNFNGYSILNTFNQMIVMITTFLNVIIASLIKSLNCCTYRCYCCKIDKVQLPSLRWAQRHVQMLHYIIVNEKLNVITM